MKAVILAAGYATRLYPLTLNTPKCLLKVGGKTILDSLYEKLAGLREIDEILIVTNAKFYAQIQDWARSARQGPSSRVLSDGTLSNETRLGAIGDLKFAIDKAGIHSDILMMASDNWFDGGLEGFRDFALSKKDAVCVGIYDIGERGLAAKKFGVVETDDDFKVTGIEEKPEHPKSSTIGMGVYFFPASTYALLDEYLALPGAQDAPGFYIRWLFEKRTTIYSFLFGGVWYDIGDLDALQEANKRKP